MIRCQYPDSGGVIECTQEQFDIVYAPKGWVEVPPDTPLTDQMYNPEGGGQPQPPPPPPPAPLAEQPSPAVVQPAPAAAPVPEPQPTPSE